VLKSINSIGLNSETNIYSGIDFLRSNILYTSCLKDTPGASEHIFFQTKAFLFADAFRKYLNIVNARKLV